MKNFHLHQFKINYKIIDPTLADVDIEPHLQENLYMLRDLVMALSPKKHVFEISVGKGPLIDFLYS